MAEELIRKIENSPPSTHDRGNELATHSARIDRLVREENICTHELTNEKVGFENEIKIVDNLTMKLNYHL